MLSIGTTAKACRFGKDSYLPENLSYLTAEQTLADFAVLIRALRESEPENAGCPYLAAGGSYGGMLAAWFRIKYPWVAQAALAASAPVIQFHGTGFDEYAFERIVTLNYAEFENTTRCSDAMAKGIRQLMATHAKALKEAFRLCDVPKSAGQVYEWLNTGVCAVH